ncbi:MAG TPA: YceI family protein [bacterium]|nr:YceI family protein [bacterium]
MATVWIRPGLVLLAAIAAGSMLCAAAAPAPAAPALRAAVIPLQAFAIVPGESSVKFDVPDNRGGFSGHTTRVTGRVEVEPAGGDVYAARISAAVDARTITTGIGMRDRAMYATFLQTATYPAITFTGTATAQPGAAVKPFPAEVRGRLVIRDVARETAFTARVLALAAEYTADATATVRMADYGIPYPRAFIFVARDPVTVTLHIVARAP